MNCILTLFDHNCLGYSDVAINTFKKFSIVNGFEFVYFDKPFSTDIEPPWNKLLAIQECFRRGYKRVFWVDIDSLYIGKHPLVYDPNVPFYINSDSNGICTSHMLIQNTTFNDRLLSTLLLLGDVKSETLFGKGRKWEQNTLKALRLHFNIPLVMFPQNFVTEPKYQSHESNTQFLHYAIMTHKEREEIMNKHYKELSL